MNREQIINEFTSKIKDFQLMALNIAGEQDADDLFQTCMLMLLEFPEDRLISYYNPTQGLKPIFIRILCNQYKSKTSKFHKLYRKEGEELRNKAEDILLNAPKSEDEPDIKYLEQIEIACASLYDLAINPQVAELEKMIWSLYVDKGSLRKTVAALPEEYKDIIDLKTVHTIVRKFQHTIKEHLSQLIF